MEDLKKEAKKLKGNRFILVQMYQGPFGKGASGYARVKIDDSKAIIEKIAGTNWVPLEKEDGIITELAKRIYLKGLKPEGEMADKVKAKMKEIRKTEEVIKRLTEETKRGYVSYELAIETYKKMNKIKKMREEDEILKLALLFPIEKAEQPSLYNYILEKYRDPNIIDEMYKFKHWYNHIFTPALWKLVKNKELVQKYLRKPNRLLGEKPNQRIVAHPSAEGAIEDRYEKLEKEQKELEEKLSQAVAHVMKRIKEEAPEIRKCMGFAGSVARPALRTPMTDIDLWTTYPYNEFFDDLVADVFRRYGIRLNITKKRELPPLRISRKKRK